MIHARVRLKTQSNKDLALLAAIAAAIPACHRRPPGPTLTFVHPNGLSLTLPEVLDGRSFLVDRTATGFSVRHAGSYRLVDSLIVDLRPGAGPPGALPRARTIGGRKIHYAVAESEGTAGSGGPEYELSAWERARAGYIVYAAREQTEWDPDFSLAWTVIEGLTPPP